MNSQPLDSSALEQKTMPVSSPDKMALDSGIDGSAKQNDSTPATAPVDSSAPIPEAAPITPAENVESPAVNGVSALVNLSNGHASDTVSQQTTVLDNEKETPKTNAEPTPAAATKLDSAEPTVSDAPAPALDPTVVNAREADRIIPNISASEPRVSEAFGSLNEAKSIGEGAGAAEPKKEVESQPSSNEKQPDVLEDGSVVQAPSTGTEEVDKMDTAEDSVPAPAVSTTELPHHPAVPAPEGKAVETPVDPAPTPAQPPATSLHPDREMLDAPISPGKNAREREDDEHEDGPASKRTKTDEGDASEPQFKVPELPSSAVAPGLATETSPAVVSAGSGAESSQHAPAEGPPITKAQHRFLLNSVRVMKRSRDGLPFLAPVDPIKLAIPSYPEIVKKPMDLSTMEEKLKQNKYSSVNEYISDFHQIVENTTIFNGIEHAVTKAAQNLKTTFNKQMNNLPKSDVVEPSPAQKKAKKATVPKAPSARRESRASTGTARSPTGTAGSPQTFALGPQGLPLIRRDSTAGDGRPKREIHPPPPRDLPYSSAKPKKKKYQLELKFCEEVMREMNKPKYQQVGWPFYNPVDPVALNIPHYHKIIKKPMDLGTIGSKLKSGQYENAKEFEIDMRLMFQNCYKFNPPADQVHQMGKEFEHAFDKKWETKKEWIEDHAPASGPQSPGSSPEPEDEEDDDEQEEEDEEENEISILQKQIAAMSKQVEMIRKKASPPAPVAKKSAKASKPAKKSKKNATTVTIPAKSDKKSKPKAKKERIPYVTYEEKQEISNRINTLPENKMATALKIIRDNMPNLKGVDDEELELDIDELSNEVLYKLLGFVRRYAPGGPDDDQSGSVRPTIESVPKGNSSKPKKNKPMSKYEQEARISELQGRLKGFQNAGSDESPEPTGHGGGEESSEDDSDSGSESEEE
ncbi:MAG: hypothetical protein M1819_002192 [Sarea resinae]|nr:MAG: hypothetical protein M1819_002192 [Sarea resinae]